MLMVAVASFAIGWAAMAVGFALSWYLGVQLIKLDWSERPIAFRRWHSMYTWPISLLRPSVWNGSLQRKLALTALVCIFVGTLSFSVCAALMLLA